MKSLTQHSLSACFPAMSAQELSDLTDDIATHGLQQSVVTLDGQVLDGWHRYQACLHAEVSPRLVEFDGDDPVAFVVSQNAHRRHLTASQRAAAIVSASAWKPQGTNQFTRGSAPGAEALAAEAGVSTRTIEHAKAAQRAGLGEAVRDGKVSAKTGAALAKLPPKQRKKAIADPEGWAEKLERKPEVPRGDQLRQEEPELDEAHERMADLAADFESALKIIEADDKLAAAFAEVKTWREKYAQLEKLYDAQRLELANMTKEAKRWKRKADEGRAA